MPGTTCMNHPVIWRGPTAIIWPCGRLAGIRRWRPGPPRRRDHVPDQGMTWRRKLNVVRSFFKILWWQGVRPSYRRQFWTQLLGMWRQNPTRFRQYFVTCVEGEDFFDMRKMVREKVTAIIKERQIEVPAAASCRGAARSSEGYGKTPRPPSFSGAWPELLTVNVWPKATRLSGPSMVFNYRCGRKAFYSKTFEKQIFFHFTAGLALLPFFPSLPGVPLF